MIIEAKYDWLGVHFSMALPVLLPAALPSFAPMAATREITHSDVIGFYTSGFV